MRIYEYVFIKRLGRKDFITVIWSGAKFRT